MIKNLLRYEMDQQDVKRTYMWLVIAAAVGACVYSILRIPLHQLDTRFFALAIFTILLSSRLTVRIPRITGHISVSDTFLFLTILLYGGEAAVLLAAAEALCSSLTFSNKSIHIKPLTIAFNSAMMALSTFVTFVCMQMLFGNVTELRRGQFSVGFIAALCVMALVQYVSNSSLAAVYTSLKTAEPIWHTWLKYYLWASITYFAGASAAGIASKLTDSVGFFALVASTPIVAIIYLTYRTYLRNIEVMAAAAKAEEAAAHAEQAELHVAELNRYIAEQKRIREQFSQIEKMSALGELASGVAHDFNNTLAGILGRAQLLLETNNPEKIQSGLHIIIKTAKDGAKTVRRIQDFARQRRDHDFQMVDVRQLLVDVSEITRPRWKNRAEAANVHIAMDLLCADGVVVMGDESELREVLVNLVFNAVDAMPDGGTLTMTAKELSDVVEISVHDTGTGMSEETRLRVFDPFFTTKDDLGMGLGLAVSYGIIRRHEGTIDVASKVGVGTTFRLRFPVAKQAATAQVVRGLQLRDATPLNSSSPRILVVDDEEYVRDILRDVLKKEGCEAIVARNGYQAMALFEKGHFDAVFTDIGMPGMNGWELSRAVRQRNAAIPIAIITGWGEVVGSQERQAAQIDWVLTKPFEMSQIAELAGKVLRRKVATERSVSAAA